MRILLIEDNPGDARLIQELLRPEDATVETAQTLRAGIECLTRQPADVVLLDLGLPDSAGLQSATRLVNAVPSVPVVVLTGSDDPRLAAETVKFGAQDYLVKGRVDLDTLRRTMRHAIERKRVEQALTESRQRYRQIVETAHEGIWVSDAHGLTTYANPRMTEMLGCQLHEMIGRSLQDFKGAGGRADVPENLDRHRVGIREEHEFVRKDGKRIQTLVSTSPIRDEAGAFTGVLAVVMDLTERKSMEEKLLQSQKLDSVGRLAGGIAHDFNNILSVVIGYALMALEKTATKDPLRKKLESVIRAGERGAALARQLLIFSRKQVVEPKVFALNLVVTDFDKMLRRLIGEDIALTLALATDAGQIRADPGQIEQVIMNLCVNARDAMPQGGTLRIVTAKVVLDEAYVRTHPDAGLGPHVMLTVSDTGTGMSSDVIGNLYEPFFTTKEPGKGTGLGLSVVYGIIKQFGGSIAVHSEAGQGTTFNVFFPCVDSTATQSAPLEVVTVAKAQGETVLVVDDEKEIRTVVQEMLEDYGYKVLVGAGPQDALRVATEHSGPLHLLLTDVVMPGLSGRGLAERVKAIHPQVKVLFMSGYTSNVILDHGVDGEMAAFLEKPFMPATLATKVREVLDAKEGAGSEEQGAGSRERVVKSVSSGQ